MYEVRFGKFSRLYANLAKFANLVGLTSFIHGKRMRNGLNEPGEDFLGTDVVPNRTCPLRLLLNFLVFLLFAPFIFLLVEASGFLFKLPTEF